VGGDYKVIFGQRSRQDLRGIVLFIRQGSGSPEIAARFGQTLIKRALSLGHMPERGRILPELAQEDVREILFRSYRIVYRIAGQEIQVLRFWHAARGTPEISVDEFRD
jgi:toxin ParE1/3/4